MNRRRSRRRPRLLPNIFEICTTAMGIGHSSLATYNAGETSVNLALARAGVSTFWQLSSQGLLPQETWNYVPAVPAAIHLLSAEQPQIDIDHETQSLHLVYALSRAVN